MSVQIVAGLSIKNLQPRVWDTASPYHLPNLSAVMVSFAEFYRSAAQLRRAQQEGLRAYLGLPAHVRIYLDNGAFYFLGRHEEMPRDTYEEFVAGARPDWYAIPQDYIPTPRMSDAEQRECLTLTMAVNRAYASDGYVPVIHISRQLDEYLRQFKACPALLAKPMVGLGGIVPNLLRAPRAMPYGVVLGHVQQVRRELADRQLHVFGMGGTATLHLAALLCIDSVDSSGWRNRAARGLVQLPGSGDRVVAELGSWRARELNAAERHTLGACPCPACRAYGMEGLAARGTVGFANRATHNLWVLLQEAEQIQSHLKAGTYPHWYVAHIENSIYRPLIDYLVHHREQEATLSAL